MIIAVDGPVALRIILAVLRLEGTDFLGILFR